MKAIKIDVIKKEVYEVEIDDSIDSIYKHLECEIFEQVGPFLPNGDAVLVDEEGLLKDEPIGAFKMGTYPAVLSGHGLIHGLNHNTGETSSAKSLVEFIRSQVKFVGVDQLPEATLTFVDWL